MKNEEILKSLERLRTFGKSNNEILDEIFIYLNNEDLSAKLSAIELLSGFSSSNKAKLKLLELSNSQNSEIRMYAIEQLEYFSGEEIGEMLIEKLFDSDCLVRITSAEIIGSIHYKKAIPELTKCLEDNDEIFRSIIAETLGEIGTKEIVPVLKEKLNEENRNIVRLGLYLGLYNLGEKEYFSKIIEMLNCKSYKVRCAAANSLVNLVNESNKFDIRNSLVKALLKEKTIAARSAITEALREVDKYL